MASEVRPPPNPQASVRLLAPAPAPCRRRVKSRCPAACRGRSVARSTDTGALLPLAALFLNGGIPEWKNALARLLVCQGIRWVTRDAAPAGAAASPVGQKR
ncbi:hypothetical protein [Azohydromonas aeria]|uniref:hypothetical protein n=1 Tax=Azohydromonas aeria TaxID=2590212 RepID=UPI0012FCDBC9|nr:hypothetical protein [Azohydromonas aeria]